MNNLTFIHYLPIGTTVISAVFALTIYSRYHRRGRHGMHLVWWSLGAFTFGLGTFAESWITLFGWNPVIFKFWYIVGALLGGAPLAQGTVWYLLKPKTARRLTIGLVVFVTISSIFAIMSPINFSLVDPHLPSGKVFEWQWVRAFSPFINTYAVIFLIGGAIYSAMRIPKQAREKETGSSVARDRFIGNVLIAVGAILPGIGGGASRAGHTEVLLLLEFIGIIVIWFGYWYNIRKNPV